MGDADEPVVAFLLFFLRLYWPEFKGHRNNRVFIMFEHSPKWSRLTIDDDVPVKLAQRHIRSTLEPYQIEFANIHAYYRWSGTN